MSFPDRCAHQNAAGFPAESGKAPPGAAFSENGSDGIIVVVVRRSDGADFRERLVAQNFAVLKNRFERVIGREGSAFNDFDGSELLAVLNEVEASALTGFGGIGFGILVNVVPLAVAVD